MQIRAQVAMVMNLDKCIGCHTCSVTCKQTWTNREGTEYVWFNNVETKPGIGYPKHYEDQEKWKGGWQLDGKGRLVLRSGGRGKRLSRLFANPDLPTLEDYYEPATFDKDVLVNAPAGLTDTPVKQPRSALTGEPMALEWGANWEDGLGGAHERAGADPNLVAMDPEAAARVKFEFEKTFMFHLPRICEHCLNPACVSACPSGAMYKREEDGIVLVDQDRCRGWRMCVTACPYKKVYVNHSTGKAEKCTFCFPRDRPVRRGRGPRRRLGRGRARPARRPAAGLPRPARPGRRSSRARGRHAPGVGGRRRGLAGVAADQ